jgi:hypothetical protein
VAPTVFRASKTAALTVALTVAPTAALTVALSVQPAPAVGSAPTAVAFRALTSARRIGVPMGALTSARRIGVPLGAPILVRMRARGRDRTSVRTSGRDQAQTLERMLEPMPRSPAQDSAPAARPHLTRVRQPVRALVRLGHLLLPQAFRGRSTPEQTAVPIVGPLATGARTAGLSGTVGQTVVPIAVPTAAQTVVPIAVPTAAQTAGPTVVLATMRSALTGVLSTTATWLVRGELPDRKADPTAHRLRQEQVEPPEWPTAAPMAELTEELTAVPKRATGLTGRPQIPTSIATISNGGLIPIDSTS